MVLPEASNRFEKLIAAEAARGSDRNLRKELGSRDADLRIGGDERLLRLLNIGTPLQQLRGHAGGRILGRRSERRWICMDDGAGILAEEQAQRIFLLLNLLLQLR